MENKVIPKTFLWMFMGLLVTFVTGIFVANNERIFMGVFGSGSFYFIIIAELIIVFILSARIYKMSATSARIWFILYSFVSGLTFSSVFIIYEISSVVYIFLIASVLFGVFSLIGYKTNKDLTKFGTILTMALVGIIICMIINLFIGNSIFDLIISILGLLLFFGITAFDMQKIKNAYYSDMNEDSVAILGALNLYLDFINIFIKLLRIFGRSRD